MINENDEVVIDLSRFWEEFKKIWLRCLTITVLFTVCGYLISAFLLTEVFTATSRLIIVQQSGTETTQQITYNDVQLSQKLVNTYTEIIKSEAILDKVIDNLNLNYNSEELNELLKVSSVNNTEVIDVSITTENPELSAKITNEIVDVFQKEIYEIMNVSNVTVLNEAKIPEEKSGPSNIKNSLIGLAIGIILSGIMLTIRVLTDTKVKTEEEVRAIFDYPIIGVIPDVDLSKYNKGDRSDD